MRPVVAAAYWHLAAERQAIFHRRLRGDPPPWTNDPILREFKFCNAFRASDRVSQFLISTVIYGEGGWSPEDLLLRIILFRLFSRIETWVQLEAHVGAIAAKTFDRQRYDAALTALAGTGPLYTSAFILAPSNRFGPIRKHEAHVALVEHMMRSHLSRNIARARSLSDVYKTLVGFPMIGPFMGYQLAVDLNYSELIDFSENDFTVAGPGAVRGIRKVFSDTGGRSAEQLIIHMVDSQDEAFSRHGLAFHDLFGRPLHAIDCQNLFCETDKYSRAAFPELKSNRVRIKARFTASSDVLSLFYPPKWQINDRISQNGRAGQN